MNPGSLTFTITVTNSDGSAVLFELSEAGSLGQGADPLVLAKEMSAAVWPIVESYAASLGT